MGRAVAEWVKREGPSLNALIARNTLREFPGADFWQLSPSQRDVVYRRIVESAGRSDAGWTALMRKLSPVGRGLLVVSIGLSVYTVATADDPGDAAGRELAVTGAGVGGGIAGGALAGLACGPGAPVCVGVGAFVGGALAAFGVDFFW